MIFLAYIGFDSIAANSAEAIDPEKTMPRGILGSLLIAVFLFVSVGLVLLGMFHIRIMPITRSPLAGHCVILAMQSLPLWLKALRS